MILAFISITFSPILTISGASQGHILFETAHPERIKVNRKPSNLPENRILSSRFIF
jgi:hypothetical protein